MSIEFNLTNVTTDQTVTPPVNDPPPEEPAAPAPDTAALEARAKEVFETMWGGNAPKPTDSDPAPSVPPPGPVEFSTPVPAVPPVSAAAPAASDEPMSTADIISRTARETAQAMRPEPSAPAAEPAAFEMTAEDREDYEAIQYLEQQNPDKYAGMADKYLAFVKALYVYIDEWEKANAGKTFDPDASEHEDWYAKNQPVIDPKAIEQAKIDLRVEARVKQVVDPKLARIEGKEAWEAALPQVAENIDSAVLRTINLVSPELAKLVTDASGKPVLNDQTIAAMEEADPIAKSILDIVVVRELKPVLLELERMAIPALGVRLNPSGNPLHAHINEYRTKMEKDMKSAPAEVRVQNGKEFLPLADYFRRQNEIQKGSGTFAEKQEKLQSMEDKYWILTVDQIAQMVVHDVGTKAKLLIEETDKLAQRKYGSQRSPTQKPAQPATPTPAPQPAPAPLPAGNKPRPPSIGGQSDLVTTPVNPTGGKKSVGDQAVEVAFR